MPDRARLNAGQGRRGQRVIPSARTEQPLLGSRLTIQTATGLEKTWTIAQKLGFP